VLPSDAVPLGQIDRAITAVARRDRLVVITGLTAVTAAAWAWLFAGAGMSMPMVADGMTKPMAWSPQYAIVMLFMWWIMMIAMMLPAAAPMILLYSLVARKNVGKQGALFSVALFAAGYLLVWGLFSLVATVSHWALESAGLISSMMASTSRWLGGGLLLAAGLYQLTPLKHACLRHCQSPVEFVSAHWQPGRFGALRMGLKHGAFCVGCCFVMMGLLFYGGVMNLFWISGLALLVLLEKLLEPTMRFAWVTGAAWILWGGFVLFEPLLGG